MRFLYKQDLNLFKKFFESFTQENVLSEADVMTAINKAILLKKFKISLYAQRWFKFRDKKLQTSCLESCHEMSHVFFVVKFLKMSYNDIIFKIQNRSSVNLCKPSEKFDFLY